MLMVKLTNIVSKLTPKSFIGLSPKNYKREKHSSLSGLFIGNKVYRVMNAAPKF
jgi:hypothetical protein